MSIPAPDGNRSQDDNVICIGILVHYRMRIIGIWALASMKKHHQVALLFLTLVRHEKVTEFIQTTALVSKFSLIKPYEIFFHFLISRFEVIFIYIWFRHVKVEMFENFSSVVIITRTVIDFPFFTLGSTLALINIRPLMRCLNIDELGVGTKTFKYFLVRFHLLTWYHRVSITYNIDFWGSSQVIKGVN